MRDSTFSAGGSTEPSVPFQIDAIDRFGIVLLPLHSNLALLLFPYRPPAGTDMPAAPAPDPLILMFWL